MAAHQGRGSLYKSRRCRVWAIVSCPDCEEEGMTTTAMFSGLDPEGRKSSRVLRPPGGGSSFSANVGELQKQQQPARRHKMASNIFGIPDNEPIPAPNAAQTESAHSSACGDVEDEQETCNQAECGEAAEHMGEAEVPETVASGKDGPRAAAGERVPPAGVPTRRNPPGGKSSLVLG